MQPLEPAAAHELLAALFPDAELAYDAAVPCTIVPAAAFRSVALHLRDHPDLAFDALMCLSGVDNGDGTLASVYHLHSMRHGHKLTVKVIVPKEDPRVPTVERIWRTADWHERESYDLIGIVYEGHRDLRRILCPYDWEGHPLRKDYAVPEYYNGMRVPY